MRELVATIEGGELAVLEYSRGAMLAEERDREKADRARDRRNERPDQKR